MFISSFFLGEKLWEQHRVTSTDECMKNNIYMIRKKETVLPVTTEMNLKDIVLHKIKTNTGEMSHDCTCIRHLK